MPHEGLCLGILYHIDTANVGNSLGPVITSMKSPIDGGKGLGFRVCSGFSEWGGIAQTLVNLSRKP